MRCPLFRTVVRLRWVAVVPVPSCVHAWVGAVLARRSAPLMGGCGCFCAVLRVRVWVGAVVLTPFWDRARGPTALTSCMSRVSHSPGAPPRAVISVPRVGLWCVHRRAKGMHGESPRNCGLPLERNWIARAGPSKVAKNPSPAVSILAPPEAHELGAHGFHRRASTTRAANDLSAERACFQTLSQSGRRGSNPRPSAWEADALPTELRPR